MAQVQTDGITYETEISTLLHEHVLREPLSAELGTVAAGTHHIVGTERLYRNKVDGSFWIHVVHYIETTDLAIPLSEREARAWLNDRCGWWGRFARLEARVFGR